LIDRIRHDIQQRLEQLVAEADKLRRALVALDPRERMSPTPKATKTQPTAKQAVKTQPALKRTPARAVSASNGATPSRRTRPGETKVKVLAALSPDQGLTAGEVAQATDGQHDAVKALQDRRRHKGRPRLSPVEQDGKAVSAAEPSALRRPPARFTTAPPAPDSGRVLEPLAERSADPCGQRNSSSVGL
jgi:hypothetical protein